MSEKLRQLRTQIENGNLTQYARFIEPLVREINSFKAFLLVTKCLYPCIPTFEILQPQIGWTRKYLELVEQARPIEYASYDFEFFPEHPLMDSNNVPNPISLAIIHTLGLLDGAYQSYWNCGIECSSELITAAIGAAIGARIMTNWAARNPVGYKKWYELYRVSREWEEPFSEEQLAKSREIMRMYHTDPIRNSIVREVLLETVDQIEHMLENGSEEKDQKP